MSTLPDPNVSTPAPSAEPTTVAPQKPRGRRDVIVILVVVLVVAAMIYSAAHFSRRGGQTGLGGTAPSALRGKAAPEFELASLEGKTTKLSDFRGKAVLLNFWATWCGPCRIEMPWFADLQNKYGSQGFQVVAVALDENADNAVGKFAKEVGANYPVLLGKDAVGDAYGVDAMPQTFYLDREGKIVNRTIGLGSRKEMEENIKAALASGSEQAAK
jgi:DsbE subfamily thiol:disulfide oxidoreductase